MENSKRVRKGSAHVHTHAVLTSLNLNVKITKRRNYEHLCFQRAVQATHPSFQRLGLPPAHLKRLHIQ